MSGRKKLGRGLDKLLQRDAQALTEAQPVGETAAASVAAADPKDSRELKDQTLRHIPVDLIQRGKYQPRTDMHQEARFRP